MQKENNKKLDRAIKELLDFHHKFINRVVESFRGINKRITNLENAK